MIISGARLNGGQYKDQLSIVTFGLALNLDATNPISYPGSGSTWTDTVAGKTFTLYNNPTYNSSNGGYLEFSPASGQFAEATSLPDTLSTWSIEVWYYNNGIYNSGSPCILTEVYAGNPINFTLGNTFDGAPVVQAGFFDGAWHATSSSYTLPSTGWFHMVGTWDGTNMKLYVNNSLISTTTPGGTSTRGGNGIRLMCRWDVPQFQGGRLAVVNIYNRALTNLEISQNFNHYRSRFGL